VDAISGGTITSKAVEEMLFKSIEHYLEYFKVAADSTAVLTPNSVNQ
jgi:Na+-transporting NADH:ubiquinone oxidoreductase subunit NqrC